MTTQPHTWDSPWQLTWGSHSTESGNLSLYWFWLQFYWEGSSGPGQGFSSQSEKGELALQDHQQIRHLSLNLPGSQEYQKSPTSFVFPSDLVQDTQASSSNSSKILSRARVLFPRALSKPTYFSQKLLCQRMSNFQKHQRKHQWAPSHPSGCAHFTPIFLWEKQWGLCLTLWEGRLASSGRSLCDPLGGNGQELVSSPHITCSESLNVLIP